MTPDRAPWRRWTGSAAGWGFEIESEAEQMFEDEPGFGYQHLLARAEVRVPGGSPS